MTEILGSDDSAVVRPPRLSDDPLAQSPASPPASIELLGDEPESWDEGPQPWHRSRWRAALGAIAEPASLAVAAALAVLVSFSIGPAYAYNSYPFNQGISSLEGLYNLSSLRIRPLHDYLYSVAPAAALVVVALVAGLLSLFRSRADQPSWARPLAAGAVLVAVILATLTLVGVWRTSTLDLTVPSQIAGTA
jgi:hypothetical protein